MVIQVLTPIFDDFRYYSNLSYIRRALEEDEVAFIGVVNNYAPEAFVFNKDCTYDFTRTAKSTIRDDMTNYLINSKVLPGLKLSDHATIKEPLDCLFNYQGYKTGLKQANSKRAESMKMLIFNDADGDQDQQYVAHVTFSCNSHRAVGQRQFTVNTTLTCQRFIYFPLQGEDFDAVLQALQNLHVTDEKASSPEDPNGDSVFERCIDRKLIKFLDFTFSRFQLLCQQEAPSSYENLYVISFIIYRKHVSR